LVRNIRVGIHGSVACPRIPIDSFIHLVHSVISIYNRNLFPFADFLAFTPGERGMVKALTERGIFTGYAIGGGKYEFRPNNTITKAEFATVVARLMNLI
jgi:hypothetical protein